MPTPVKDPLLGRTIAQRYRLISRLGAGSAASVYLARHVIIDRLGAIKIVHPELARDPLWRERFLREARAVNRINHPNIVEITDLGEADGFLFLVMEYVPGESLKQTLERGPLGWRRAAVVGLQVASALGRAHQMGVVHRGLDPSNILLVPRRDGGDLVKLTDFGVAKLADAAPLTERADLSEGSPSHPPGEEALRERDARSDLFALGAVLYEAAVGVPPGRPPERLSVQDPLTPAFFDEVVSTLLAPEPDDRPRDGFEAADLLRRAIERDVSALVTVGETLNPPSPSSPPLMSSPERASWWPLLEGATPVYEGGAPQRPSGRPVPLSEPPSARDPARAGVHGAAIDRLASICGAALGVLEERVDVAGGELDPAARAALAEARKLCTTVAALSELTASDSRALEAVQARGRGARAELGRRLDEAAREHSRTLGWAGTIAERSYEVEVQRLSGEHPVPAIEAMVWEQAALEQEEDTAREKAARLAAEMRACQTEIERHNERLEHEILVVNACLEGRIGALRALSFEAWAALEAAARAAGVPSTELRAPGR
jgi:tRNA A-37 threonylcarbamoyl transferase component Bud32